MKVKQKLYISDKECFDVIVQSVLYDIKQVKGKTLTLRKLQGYSYQRTMSNGALTTTTIEEITPNSVYRFQTKGRVNTHTTTYTITPNSEHSCEVEYAETITAEATMQKLNNALVGFIFGFFRKRKVKNLLKSIELSVINQNKEKQKTGQNVEAPSEK
ncbi:DUF3284 domain-containing protein [Listeria ilorinensis]|uniref:DUF3284 domain-containing protein n=1 Tax=Listeria ilorinensis TaxID=2867439 RepID=UPI001EF6A3F3|nr:DUF3284 domain-containing protein [Listeria ilorinensis]